MKKKWVAVLLTVTLIGGMTACEPKEAEPTAQPVEEAVVEEVVEEPAAEVVEEEEAPAEEVTTEESTSDNVAEEVTPVETEFTGEQAMEKVKLLFKAYDDLMKQDKELEYTIQDRCERFRPLNVVEVKTSDGLDLNYTEQYTDDVSVFKGANTSIAFGYNYYYDYVNNGVAYYDFEEYIASHTSDEILYKMYSDEDYKIWNSGNSDTDKNLMMGAVRAIPSLVGHDITAEVLNSGDDCICPDVSGRKVAYELPLILDGKPSTFYAVFDEERNLINISWPDGRGDTEEKYTFDGITE